MRPPRDEISTSGNKPVLLDLQVEPVATFESSALQSSWIQRLKPAAASTFQERAAPQAAPGLDMDYSSQQLWNKLKLSSEVPLSQQQQQQEERPTVEKFVLGTRTPPQRSVPASKNITGLNRAKSSNVKLGKPPLPPTSRSGNVKGKDAKVTQWKVHTVEAKSDQQQQQRNASSGWRRDFFAEFAARLEIKESETCNQQEPQQQQQQFQKLTPVIAPTGTLLIPLREDGGLEGLGFTRGSNTASLSPRAIDRCKAENGSKDSSDDCFKPQLRSESSHCSNFPCPDATASESFSRRACIASTGTATVIKVEQEATVPVFQLSRRRNNQAESRNVDNLERQKSLKRTYFEEFQDDKDRKKSRLPTEASSLKDKVAMNASTRNTSTVPLSGIWLERWNSRSTTPATKTAKRPGAMKTFVDHSRKTGPRPGTLKTLVDRPRKTVDTPNAAAFAIVGTASRQLRQSSRENRLKVS